MGQLSLDNVRKSFGTAEVIKGVSLNVQHGEFVVFVGPSGCGKSTLLRMIAGLEEISDGTISIDGNVVNNLPPVKRGISMVFQSYALYPHMSVYENIAFPLRVDRMDKENLDKRVKQASAILHLDERLHHKPGQLSGGQRQRVAIGRAIVREPAVFLFDEPLSNLDAALRAEMRIELSKLHGDLDATMIYVTHDQVEAMTMANRIVVLDAGYIAQVGTPLELYHKPDNIFVAGFIGNPKMNFLPVTCVDSSDEHIEVKLPNDETLNISINAKAGLAGDKMTLGIRPEHIRFGSGDAVIKANPSVIERLGIHTVAYTTVIDSPTSFCALLEGSAPAKVGTSLSMGLMANDCHLFAEDGTAFERRIPLTEIDPTLMISADSQ